MTVAELSIVIPTLNNHDYLKITIDSILSSTNLKLEIIIVDDGSGSPELEEYFRSDKVFRFMKIFKIIKNRLNLGFIKSVNAGVRETTSQYVLILNNDVFVPPKALDKMLAVLKNNEDIGAVGPYSNFVMEEQLLEMDYQDPALEPLTFVKKINKLDNIQPALKDAIYLSGFCLMLKRKVIEEVSTDGMLFDEIYGFGYAEDCDLSKRIKKLNYRLVVVRNAFVHHYGSKTFAPEMQAELVRKNEIIFNKRWS